MCFGLPYKTIAIVQVNLMVRLHVQVSHLRNVPLYICDSVGLRHFVDGFGDLWPHGDRVEKKELEEKLVLNKNVRAVSLDVLDFVREGHGV